MISVSVTYIFITASVLVLSNYFILKDFFIWDTHGYKTHMHWNRIKDILCSNLILENIDNFYSLFVNIKWTCFDFTQSRYV
jgi:hypothetical protein